MAAEHNEWVDRVAFSPAPGWNVDGRCAGVSVCDRETERESTHSRSRERGSHSILVTIIPVYTMSHNIKTPSEMNDITHTATV